MPKTNAPFTPPAGRKWCSRHNDGNGGFLATSLFPSERDSYCKECKREYQRQWDRENRVRPDVIVEPKAKLSANQKKIIIHLPNTEKARNATRELFTRFHDSELDWE